MLGVAQMCMKCSAARQAMEAIGQGSDSSGSSAVGSDSDSDDDSDDASTMGGTTVGPSHKGSTLNHSTLGSSSGGGVPLGGTNGIDDVSRGVASGSNSYNVASTRGSGSSDSSSTAGAPSTVGGRNSISAQHTSPPHQRGKQPAAPSSVAGASTYGGSTTSATRAAPSAKGSAWSVPVPRHGNTPSLAGSMASLSMDNTSGGGKFARVRAVSLSKPPSSYHSSYHETNHADCKM